VVAANSSGANSLASDLPITRTAVEVPGRGQYGVLAHYWERVLKALPNEDWNEKSALTITKRTDADLSDGLTTRLRRAILLLLRDQHEFSRRQFGGDTGSPSRRSAFVST